MTPIPAKAAHAQRRRRVLLALRAVGPCSNRELAAALKVPAVDCYKTVGNLRNRGWAVRLGEELYDVTAEGRRVLLVGEKMAVPGVGLFQVAEGVR